LYWNGVNEGQILEWNYTTAD